jgi:hypothetical protein
MLLGAAEGVRSEVIACFAFDNAPLRAQYSANRERAGREAGEAVETLLLRRLGDKF